MSDAFVPDLIEALSPHEAYLVPGGLMKAHDALAADAAGKPPEVVRGMVDDLLASRVAREKLFKPTAPAHVPSAIAAALEEYKDRLAPAAADQLATLWKDEFRGLHPNAVADLVKIRLAEPRYSHFLRAGAATRPAAPSGAGTGPASETPEDPIVSRLRETIARQQAGGLGTGAGAGSSPAWGLGFHGGATR